MRPISIARSKRKGMTLIESLIASTVLALVLLMTLEILVEGARFLNLNQAAFDAQRNGLTLSSQLCTGLQSAKSTLIKTTAAGVVFPSPYKADGTTAFDPSTHKLLWQRWVCYYFDAGNAVVTRRELPITPANSTPAPIPAAETFASVPIMAQSASDINAFRISQLSAVPPLWAVNITVGDMNNQATYGVELYTKVSPRN